MKNIILNSRNSNIKIGNNTTIKVNCNIGVNSKREYNSELRKVDLILKDDDIKPDIMMDLSTLDTKSPLYKYIYQNYSIPVGTVPCYSFKSFNKNSILEQLHEQAEAGVAFYTLHFTANKNLLNLAKKSRIIPTTSRGGGIMLRNQSNKTENILLSIIDEIIEIALKFDIAISLGSTFRPATIFDALDEVHSEETAQQLKICKYLQDRNVKVIVENIGHIELHKLEQHKEELNKFHAPIMPLGPLPTDSAIGLDHIASAVGASFSAYWGVAHIINAITPIEHSNAIIDIENTRIGLKTAKLVAHILNLQKSEIDRLKDLKITETRAKYQSCMNNYSGCDRCSNYCPLNL